MDDDRIADIVGQWGRERPDLDPTPLLIIGRIQQLAAVLDVALRPPFAAADLGNGDFDVLAALRRGRRALHAHGGPRWPSGCS